MTFIERDDLIHGGIYRLHARNLALGIYNEHTEGFTGIRSKFGARFLDVEYLWDRGGRGTARPLELIEVRLDFEPVDGWWDERWSYNEGLFRYLDTTYYKEDR